MPSKKNIPRLTLYMDLRYPIKYNYEKSLTLIFKHVLFLRKKTK